MQSLLSLKEKSPALALGPGSPSAYTLPGLSSNDHRLHICNIWQEANNAQNKVEAKNYDDSTLSPKMINHGFIRISSPPEGFCIGVLAFVTSLKEVPSMASQLEDSLRSSWAPGAVLRLLVIPPSSADKEDLTNFSLSSIYLFSTLYLMRSNHRATLHRIHPFTGTVLNVLQKNSELAYLPSPLQVLEASS